ncbi:MAG: trypsin-like peptidase domain-containing protein, partial [Chloroflexota bacterium]|nr:trypsin-like peptidase domain-containing protein [Chloroflexota bacterium]
MSVLPKMYAVVIGLALLLAATGCIVVETPDTPATVEAELTRVATKATPDVQAMVSAELTRAAPTATPQPTPVNVQPPNPTDDPPQQTATPQPTATLQHLHSGPTIAELVARLRPSLAHIRTSSGSGSGFVYDRSGLVATNAHVVDCCRNVTVIVNNRRYQGKVLGRDDHADLAVVRINSGSQFTQASLGNARQVAVGDEVVALGFPLNLGDDLTATKGIVSSRRTLGGYEHFQHDASVNPGNSGGPLINLDGVVIGMNTSKHKDAEGVGFALSVGEMDGRLAALAGYAAAPTIRPQPTATRTPTPTRQAAVGDYQQVSGFAWHSCALKNNGSIVCWGKDSFGEATPPAGAFRQVTAGSIQTCGLRTDGQIVCWGRAFTQPEGDFHQISAGQMHTCGVKTNGRVACWGGEDAYTGQSAPTVDEFKQVTAGSKYSCGVKTNARVVCWGRNDYGQATPSAGAFSQVSAGFNHTCGVKTNARVVCWGRNDYGQ